MNPEERKACEALLTCVNAGQHPSPEMYEAVPEPFRQGIKVMEMIAGGNSGDPELLRQVDVLQAALVEKGSPADAQILQQVHAFQTLIHIPQGPAKVLSDLFVMEANDVIDEMMGRLPAFVSAMVQARLLLGESPSESKQFISNRLLRCLQEMADDPLAIDE